MFLLDERYPTVVALVEGFSLGSPEVPLLGFQAWLSRKLGCHPSPLHWSALIAHEVGGPEASPATLSAEVEGRAVALLLDALWDHFAEAGR